MHNRTGTTKTETAPKKGITHLPTKIESCQCFLCVVQILLHFLAHVENGTVTATHTRTHTHYNKQRESALNYKATKSNRRFTLCTAHPGEASPDSAGTVSTRVRKVPHNVRLLPPIYNRRRLRWRGSGHRRCALCDRQTNDSRQTKTKTLALRHRLKCFYTQTDKRIRK